MIINDNAKIIIERLQQQSSLAFPSPSSVFFSSIRRLYSKNISTSASEPNSRRRCHLKVQTHTINATIKKKVTDTGFRLHIYEIVINKCKQGTPFPCNFHSASANQPLFWLHQPDSPIYRVTDSARKALTATLILLSAQISVPPLLPKYILFISY